MFPSYAAPVPALPRPLLVDLPLAAALTGLSLAGLLTHASGPVPEHAYLLAVLAAAPMALRQVAPVTTTSVVLVASTGYALIAHGALPNNGLGVLLGMFTVAMLRTWRAAATTFLATALALASGCTALTSVAWPVYVQSVIVVAGAWALGDGTRRWARRAEDLAAQSAVAVAAERVRIARELHDVVAHHMAVISLHAGVAEYVLDGDRAAAKQAIATVGSASRDALAEMRLLLGVLRTDDPDDAETAYRPQPELASLEELADRVRAAGLTVSMRVSGRVRDLPAGPNRTAFRVVQESLTNVVKHAGPASALIELDYGISTLTISVTDDGAGAPEIGPAADAHGIRGMRERVELFGGTFVAEPSPCGGFAVRARLPIPEAS